MKRIIEESGNLLTVPQFAERLHIAEVTARKRVARREVTHVKIGRAVRIPESEVERIIQAGMVPALDR
jgi:excisionase family DNA binding protein